MATAKLSLSFRIFKNGELVRETQLSQGVIKIGKVASSHLQLEDEQVSRMHAIIEVLGDEVSVIDLGSTSGTFVNGQRINKARLQSGDTIVLGQSRLELAIARTDMVIEPAKAEPAKAAVVIAQPPAIPVRPPVPAATMALPAVKPAAPITPAAPVARPVTQPAMYGATPNATGDELVGAQAIEVAAMLGESVVGVKHCMDPRGGKVTGATWGIAAGGLAFLLVSAGAFIAAISNASANQSALEAHIARGKPAWSFRPESLSAAVDVLAFGGLALGIAGLAFAFARALRERRSPSYRIGTAPGVELPLEQAPSADFPLVAPQGDDFVFNYGAGMDGELTVGGSTTPFSELLAQGRARPSTATAGAIEIPIPANAKIRARAGQATFLVSAVAKPREHAAPLFSLESRTLAYGAGSLAAHLALVALLSQVPVDSAGVNVDMAMKEGLTGRTQFAEKEPMPEKLEEEQSSTEPGGEAENIAMALPEGAAGKPDALKADGRMEVKDNGPEKQMSRQEAIEAARIAGVLGSTREIEGGIKALTGGDLSSGFDGSDIYGPLFGTSGEGRGNFGMGRNDFGPGGGCLREPCGTLPATGRYATIPGGRGAGGDWRGPGQGWGRGPGRNSAVPQPTIGQPTTGGGLDKAIIKRYIKRQLHQISYCYEKELLARPGIEGTVSISFMISGTGIVTSSAGNGFDGTVATCVAGIIKNINFPRPTDGGTVQVNYPFTFHAAGK